jgi:hypothetical protein
MSFVLTDNPRKAARWATLEQAREAALRWASGQLFRPDVRAEPSDDRKGYAVRVYRAGGCPVAAKLGWLVEKRIVRVKRRKVEDDD